MTNKYIELYRVPIEEVYDFCPLQLRKLIKKRSIVSLGQLIDLAETKYVIKEVVNMDILTDSDSYYYSYLAVMGTIKILKYKYLGIDPKFDYNHTLEQLGFSSAVAKHIKRILESNNKYNYSEKYTYYNYKKDNITNIYEVLANEKIKLQFEADFTKSAYRPTGKEFMCKLPILEKYFKEKENGVFLNNCNEDKIEKNEDLNAIDNKIEKNEDLNTSDEDIKKLYDKLGYLLKQHQLLSEQILIVQEKISEKIKGGMLNGPTRKK